MTVKKTTNPADVCTLQDAIDDWDVRFFDLMEKVEEHYGNKAPLDCAAVPMSVASQYLDAHNKAYILDAGLDLSTIATLADLSREYQNALIIELEEVPTVTAEDAAQIWKNNFAGMIEGLKANHMPYPDSEINAAYAILHMSDDERSLIYQAMPFDIDVDGVVSLADLKQVYQDSVITEWESDPEDSDDDDA
jgi:hypothetical protein